MAEQVEIIDRVRAGGHSRPPDAAFAPALAVGTDNPPRRSWNPADSASRSAGTRPVADTKFGSSKTGRIV